MRSANDEIMKHESSWSTSQQFGCRKSCVGCGAAITERFYAQVYPNLDWHSECLRCVECHQQLDGTCFMKSGRPYCKADYLRIYSVACAKCGDVLKRDEYVMKAQENFYHVDCFVCTACSKQLNMGDFCAVLKDGLFCRSDYEAIERPNENRLLGELNGPAPRKDDHLNASDSDREQKPLTVITNSPDSSAIVNSPQSTISSMDTNLKSENAAGTAAAKNQDGNNNTNGAQNENNQQGGSHSKSSKQSKVAKDGKEKKTTRVRTVLNEKQLHTLRACYAANPRPDALMKDQLVEMTQLSPRVIRVWFQNKRCKDKKRMMILKQMQQQQQEKAVLQRQFQGIPLVAPQPTPMMYDQVGNMHLAAADIVTVQNPNVKAGMPMQVATPNSMPSSSAQLWNPMAMAGANSQFAHHELISPHSGNPGRPMLANATELGHLGDSNANAFSHLHLSGMYQTQHDDDTIVSMDGDRSCYSR